MQVDHNVRREAVLAIFRDLDVSVTGRLFRATLLKHWEQTGLRDDDLDAAIAAMTADGQLEVEDDREEDDQLVTLTHSGFQAAHSLPGGLRAWISQAKSAKTLLAARRRARGTVRTAEHRDRRHADHSAAS